MRSRTSRGVPEWSGGKELYIGSAVLAIGTTFGVIGIVPGPPEGSRGSTRWGHLPRWATWALGGAPWPVWAKGNQPQRAHAPRVPSRRSPRWIRHLLDGLGGRETSLAAAPLGDWISQGRRPPPPPQEAYIKGGRGGGLRTHCPGASLSLSNTSSSSVELGEALPEYCSSTITTPSCCCWSHHPQPLLPPCWIKKKETLR